MQNCTFVYFNGHRLAGILVELGFLLMQLKGKRPKGWSILRPPSHRWQGRSKSRQLSRGFTSPHKVLNTVRMGLFISHGPKCFKLTGGSACQRWILKFDIQAIHRRSLFREWASLNLTLTYSKPKMLFF